MQHSAMTSSKFFVPLIAAGAFLFNIIFWQEQLALNALLFDVFIIGAVFYYYPLAQQNANTRWVLVAHILCLFALILQNTLLDKVAFASSLLLFIGFAQYTHRSIWFAGSAGLLNFVLFIASLSDKIRSTPKIKRKKSKGKLIRFAIFPALLLILFFVIYNLANGVLAGWTIQVGNWLDKGLLNFFDLFSIQRILFLLLGFYITGSLLMRMKWRNLENKELIFSDGLKRIRSSRWHRAKNWWDDIIIAIMGKLAKGMMALKNENTVGVISLVLLNILLLVVNTIDISYLWFNFSYTPDINLSAMTHEGTELLIISIVLAMIVLLFFFKGNLNFYKRNKLLKMGAYAWIIQNMVLVVSVFMRDYYYIVQFGLSYKRIGIFFFLVMVLTGLITVFVKIEYKKTGYFLWRINAWAALVLLVIGSAFNWDVYIAKYNIANRKRNAIDIPYLLTFSDKVLPVLDQNRQVLREREKELNNNKIALDRCTGCIDIIIDNWKHRYLKEQNSYTWLSWNYADDEIKKKLNNPEPKKITEK
jgi:hypothetical protein